jgi:hypothetical protein
MAASADEMDSFVESLGATDKPRSLDFSPSSVVEATQAKDEPSDE